MRRNRYLVVLVVLAVTTFFGFKIAENKDKEKVLMAVMEWVLVNGHYSPIEIDDDFSNAIFTKFIEEIDPSKRFFTQEDIQDFARFQNLIDDQFKNQDLSFFNYVFERYEDKETASQQIYQDILATPFDYSIEESLDTNYENIGYSDNNEALKNRWRQQLKLTTLGRIYDKLEVEEDKVKEDPNYVKKSLEELEKESRERTLSNMDDLYDRMDEMRREDWLGVYVNTIVEQFDPHSSYLSPEIKERFDISMSGKLEGIGARLTKEKEYTKVAELISGGPAWKQGGLEVGDLILKVAQGNQEPVDIVGMRLDDAIKFIKGDKGTIVNLTVKKIDGRTEVISIVRDEVQIEETFLKTSLVNMDNKKMAVINLPKFYIDFNDKNYRDSGKDMKQALEELNQSDVDGVVIDLRNNGGGSLKTAIDISGLFIKKGPVVQVKNRVEEPKIYSDNDNKILWDKPIVILVNELSASASEIFAAAMQDYNRAIIMGSNQSFGKGTVQNVIPLNEYYNFSEDLGALKMTIQKFYRINGGSTQLEGVSSDIPMPGRYSYMEIGEREFNNPLPYDRIRAASYTSTDSYSNKDLVIQKSKERMLSNPKFMLIDDFAKWTKENANDSKYSLNLNTFIAEAKEHELDAKRFDTVYRFQSDLSFYSPNSELPLIAQDSILGKKRDIWHTNLSQDIYINEALKVLKDLNMSSTERVVGQN